jgi:hypothetical protein
LTVLLATNATGTSKLKPLVIGKYEHPRCFKNINMSMLPVTYKSNSKAWMRHDIFENWLKDLDHKFQMEHRKILLLVDNAASHTNPGHIDDDDHQDQIQTHLKNIKLQYLPPNTTAHLQPCDAGIINNFKV